MRKRSFTATVATICATVAVFGCDAGAESAQVATVIEPPPPEVTWEPPTAGASLDELATWFTTRDGYSVVDEEMFASTIEAIVRGESGSGVMRPTAELGPLVSSILALEASEGTLQRVRYRLRYGAATPDGRSASEGGIVSLVQVDRFNLGPAIRGELIEELGEHVVAPVEEFGVGPDVSLLLVMRPVMGQTANILAVARRELSESDARMQSCLGRRCTSTSPGAEDVMEWQATAELELGFEPSYELERDGMLTPAAAIDVISVEMGAAHVDDGRLRWDGFELRESVAPGMPFAEAVIEVGLGQDGALDAYMRDGDLMDDELLASWVRLVSLPRAQGAPPANYVARAYERRAGRD